MKTEVLLCRPACRENMAEDFETHVLPLLERYPGRLRREGITLENFHVAASYVASRAFGIDDYHGESTINFCWWAGGIAMVW